MKNYIKQIIRTPVKTFLFIMLTAFISVLLTIGFAMYISGDEELKKANKNYIAEVVVENREWLEMGYNPKAQNISLKEIDAIRKSEYIGKFEMQRNLIGYAENFEPFYNFTYKTIYDDYPNSMLDVTILSEVNRNDYLKIFGSRYYNETNVKTYKAKINKILTGKEDEEEIYIKVNGHIFGDDTNNLLQAGKRYIVNLTYGEMMVFSATWKHGESKAKELNAAVSYYLIPVYEENYKEGKYFAAQEISNDDYFSDEKVNPYIRIANEYNTNMKEFDIAYVSSTKNIKSFYKNEMVIRRGRDISDKEYKNGSRVCLVSEVMLEKNKLSVGSKISFKYAENNNELIGFADNIKVLNNTKERQYFEDVQTYEIVGTYIGNKVTADYNEAYSFDQSVVIVPIASFPKENAVNAYSSDMCASSNLTIALKNSTEKNDFLLEMKAKGLDFDKYNIIINTKDVESIINTFKEMKQTSSVLITGCIIVAFLIVFFIVFLFISKRKTDMAVLVALGTKKNKIIAGYLLSISIIVLIGSIAGVIVGDIFAEDIINDAYIKVKEDISTTGNMFSTIYSVNIARQYSATVDIPYTVPVGITLSIFFLTAVTGYISVKRNLKKEPIVLLSTQDR